MYRGLRNLLLREPRDRHSANSLLRLQKKSLFVQLHGWYTADNYVYLAMEYCVFGDIKKCFPHPLSEAKSRSICEQLLEGLVLLHDMGIAHRDIKPEVS